MVRSNISDTFQNAFADLGTHRPADPETGARIPPSALERFRRMHYYRAPNCFCSLEFDVPYVETKISLVVAPPSGAQGSLAFLNGEYIAECALKRCGYFGELSV